MLSTRPGPTKLLPPRPWIVLCSGAFSLACLCRGQGQLPAPAAVLGTRQTAQPSPAAAVQPARITGEIVDGDGSLIAGASVVLTSGSAVARQALTDNNGQFAFSDVPPGPYTLAVTLQGFNPASQTGELLPGQTLDLSQITLALAVVNISVNAISTEQAALEQLHTEEHQRLVGVLPNFFVSYNWSAPPLTTRQKYALATHNVLDPGNLALAGTVAGIQQAADAFPGYHQGAAGYGKRFGADLANLVVGTYMGGAVLPSLFHQDPRYFYKGTGTKRSRFLYAISRAVVTRGDNGRNQPNFAGVLGDLSAAALSNTYYPASDRQGATLFFENGILSIAGDAMNDVVQEFVFNHITTKGKKIKAQP